MGEMTWRPIETAPKDGTDILLGFEPAIGWQRIGKAWGGQWVSAWNHHPIHDQPTHWMPLPEPPE